MKFSNRSGLPDALVNAIKNDPYDKGGSEFSVTQLIGPARQAALRETHKDEIEEDAEERLFAFYGQIGHGILERANRNAIAEKRYHGVIGGATVSGQLDTLDLDGGTLSDWKFTTSWGFKPGTPPKPEWVQQLNMQLELLRQNGMNATKLQIVGLLRDFSKMEAMRNQDYPRQPVVIMPIPMWDRAKTVEFMWSRIVAHREARKMLPECTNEERWAKPDVHAVMKRGRKSAVRLYDTAAEALAHAGTSSDLSVQFRRGTNTRCEAYCNISKFCAQFKSLTAAAAKPLASVADLNEANDGEESA
jgi:hypothetical protein